MTKAQTLRLKGFNASLAQRGVGLFLDESNPAVSFDALVEPVAPDSGEFEVSEPTRDAARVHILRTSENIGDVGVGSSLVDQDTDKTYRVTKVIDRQPSIVIIFECEQCSIL